MTMIIKRQKFFPDSCAVTALHRWFPIFSFETR